METPVLVWSARLAVACYVVCLGIGTAWPPSRRPVRIQRLVWTFGCGVFLVHVASALDYRGWSHQAAYRHTAGRTAELTGLDWGGGLYFNYAFTLLWLADAVCWWVCPRDPFRHVGPVRVAAQAFYAFLVINATVVFGPEGWGWAGLAAVVLLLAAWRYRANHADLGRS